MCQSVFEWCGKVNNRLFHASFVLPGICRTCRKKLKTMRPAELATAVKDIETQMEDVSLQVASLFF